MKGLLIAGVATSVFTFAAGAASGALIIDDFTDVNTSGTVTVPGGNPGPGNLTETGLSGVLGGSREITINRTLNQSNTVSGTVNTGAGRIEFLTASNQDAADFILDYVMDSVDLTGGGANNAFGLTFDFASFPTTTVDITAVDAGANSDTASVNIPGNFSPADHFLPFSSFSGVNFTQITELTVTINGVQDGDYQLGFLEADVVPEPAGAALLGFLGALTLAARRRHS